MPASSEFVSLCRSQVTLLTRGLGASLIAVYLTEELADGSEAKLIPIVVHPEEAMPWRESISLRLPTNPNETQPYLLLADSKIMPEDRGTNVSQEAQTQTAESVPQSTAMEASPLSLLGQQRIVLPLIHEGIVLGLLVTSRKDRQWYEWEHNQLEQVAHTLAIACILDQRYQWLEHSSYDQQLFQAQQRDTLKDLLHQFRNPLTALKTFGKLLVRRFQPGEANREVADSIVRESDRLQGLLQEFDATIDPGEAKITSGKAISPLTGSKFLPSTINLQQSVLREQPVPKPLLTASGLLVDTDLPLESCLVSQVLKPLLVSARAIAQERNLVLRADIPPNLPPVQANNSALQEVCTNLIDNALKYTPAKGQISVQVSQHQSDSDNYQVIIVSDTGPGIPSEDLNYVFERHYRGVQAQTEIPGTGLGLAIAHELVEQMQGKIQAFSPALNKRDAGELASWGPGSTFVIWLPEMKDSNKSQFYEQDLS